MNYNLKIIQTAKIGPTFSVMKNRKNLGSFITKMQGYILLLDLFSNKTLIAEDVLELTEKIHEHTSISIIITKRPVSSYHTDLTDQCYFMNLSIAKAFIDVGTVSQIPGIIEYKDDYEHYAKLIISPPEIQKRKVGYRTIIPRVHTFYSKIQGQLLVMKYLLDVKISFEQARYLQDRISKLNLPLRTQFKIKELM